MSGSLSTLSASEEKALSELRDMVPEGQKANESTLLRFLRARNFVPSEAYKQYAATLNWREKNGVDDLLSHKRPLEEELKNVMSSAFHKMDKEGRPCYIEHTGRADILALTKLPIDDVVRWHIWNNEMQIHRMEELSKQFNKNVQTMVHIHDLTGATLLLRKAMHILRKISKLDQEYYPERMGKIFIVNTPWIFPILWKIARVFLDPTTRSKCIVLEVGETHKLLEYFNKEDLPVEFGGDCQCTHGCLPPIPKHMQQIVDVPPLTEHTIVARTCFEWKVECKDAGQSLGWYFQASSKDLKFGVKFIRNKECVNNNEGSEEWVDELDWIPESDVPITGFFCCPCAGVCTFIWDNTQNRFMSRTIKYHVMVMEDAESPEVDGFHSTPGCSRST